GDLLEILGSEIFDRFEKEFRVIVVVSGGWVYASYCAEQFSSMENVRGRNGLGEKFEPRLVVDTSIEEEIVSDDFFKPCAAPILHRSLVTSPVVRNRAAAMWNNKLQIGEHLKEVRIDDLHEGGGVAV